ncbi:cytochrome b-c1 complex subunit 7-like isoform X2 [Hyposmocoma kahamanoa]|uniref:cytochrome b-c1 complex subunit 7-like isoform X2 n=1 Tax=Hyposmocoma kahamanoa TaxID=1477025 RepID=UPI000E6D9795|nr:cytochrome b-c1 complex subunit 7-like isoform X2 [Hyposmocoma kahamanoa]
MAFSVFRRTPVLCKSLYRDDCLYEGDPDVEEALRRLPKHLIDERNFRLIRAIQVNITKHYLPKEEWTRYEDDVLYLSPIVDQVRKERLEREKWEKEH